MVAYDNIYHITIPVYNVQPQILRMKIYEFHNKNFNLHFCVVSLPYKCCIVIAAVCHNCNSCSVSQL